MLGEMCGKEESEREKDKKRRKQILRMVMLSAAVQLFTELNTSFQMEELDKRRRAGVTGGKG